MAEVSPPSPQTALCQERRRNPTPTVALCSTTTLSPQAPHEYTLSQGHARQTYADGRSVARCVLARNSKQPPRGAVSNSPPLQPSFTTALQGNAAPVSVDALQTLECGSLSALTSIVERTQSCLKMKGPWSGDGVVFGIDQPPCCGTKPLWETSTIHDGHAGGADNHLPGAVSEQRVTLATRISTWNLYMPCEITACRFCSLPASPRPAS